MTGGCGSSYNQRWRGSGQRSVAMWADQANNSLWVPVDFEETAQHYTFVADVPGLGKNDVKVSCIALWLWALEVPCAVFDTDCTRFPAISHKETAVQICLAMHRFKLTRTVN